MLTCRNALAEESIADQSHQQLLSNCDDNTEMKRAYLSSGDYLLLYTRQCPPLIHLKRENPLG